jgi:hypothetical protein
MKRTAWLLMVAALLAGACSSEAEKPALSRQELLDPTSCKDCHPKHYREWSASMHAYSMKDPVFLAMNKRGQEETNGELGKFCVNCHAPMAVREKAITDYADLSGVPEPLQGVTCYFCHNAVDVEEDHVNANIILANDNIMRAALRNPVEPTTHRVQFSDNHDRQNIKSSILCGTCHDIRTPRGVALERTLQEYQASVVAQPNPLIFQSCQGCHMDTSSKKQEAALMTGRPGEGVAARNVHEHLWPGVDVPLTDFPHVDALRSAVENCQLQAMSINYFEVLQRSPAAFAVSVESQAGHNQPSGASQDRRMWLELYAYDSDGKLLYQEGVIRDGEVEDPQENRHPFMMRDYGQGENGEDAHMFWDVASIQGSTIPTATPTNSAAGTHTFMRTFRIRTNLPVARYEMRMRMRPVGVDVLQDLVKSGHLAPEIVAKMPTFTMLTKAFDKDFKELNADSTLQFAGDTNPDCDMWKCLLDSSSPDCMR